jgi:hypothetical protein
VNTSPPYVLGYLNGGQIAGVFLESMLALFRREQPVIFSGRSGPDVAAGFNWIVASFLERTDLPYLFLVDSDVSFDPDVPHRLIETGHDAVSGFYFGQAPIETMGHDPDGGPWRAYGLTTMATLYTRRALEAVRELDYPPKAPWFAQSVRGGELISQDMELGFRLREAGFECWIDPRIRVGHTELLTVEWADGNWRFAEGVLLVPGDATGSRRCGPTLRGCREAANSAAAPQGDDRLVPAREASAEGTV